jgi:hypothetical protein
MLQYQFTIIKVYRGILYKKGDILKYDKLDRSLALDIKQMLYAGHLRILKKDKKNVYVADKMEYAKQDIILNKAIKNKENKGFSIKKTSKRKKKKNIK